MNYSDPTVGEVMKEIDCHGLAGRYPKYPRWDAFVLPLAITGVRGFIWKVIRTLVGHKSLLAMGIYARFVEENI